MYDILQLHDMLVNELRDVAEKLGVKGYKSLNKQEMVYKILDQQAINAGEKSNETTEKKTPTAKEKPKAMKKPKAPIKKEPQL